MGQGRGCSPGGPVAAVATAAEPDHHVFVVGQGIIVSSAAMDLAASTPSFGAGASLWALALVLISTSAVLPSVVRGASDSSLLFCSP
jgi:hypothetical protein